MRRVYLILFTVLGVVRNIGPRLPDVYGDTKTCQTWGENLLARIEPSRSTTNLAPTITVGAGTGIAIAGFATFMSSAVVGVVSIITGGTTATGTAAPLIIGGINISSACMGGMMIGGVLLCGGIVIAGIGGVALVYYAYNA